MTSHGGELAPAVWRRLGTLRVSRRTLLKQCGAVTGSLLSAGALADLLTSCQRDSGRQVERMIDVSRFGADPTASRDSAPAINRALTSRQSSERVFIPSGRYRINSVIRVPSNTTLVMDPNATLLRTFKGATIGIFNVNNVAIIGGNLDLPSTGQTIGQHLFCLASNNVTIHNVRAGTQLSGTPMFWVLDGTNVLISGCSLINPRTEIGLNDGIAISSGHNIRVTKCVIQTGDDSIVVGSYGVGRMNASHITVSDCDTHSGSRCIAIYTQSPTQNVSDVSVSGISGHTFNSSAPVVMVKNFVDNSLTRVSNVLISNCSPSMTLNNAGTPCYLLENVSNVRINNCNMATGQFTNTGMYLDGAQHCRASDCTITGNSVGVMEVNGADYNTIVGNNLHSNSTATGGSPGANSVYANNQQ